MGKIMARSGYWLYAILIVFMFGLSAWAWNKVPDTARIPVHWGLEGPDRYGGKLEGLLLIPLISLVFPLLYALIPRIDPRAANIEKSRKAYSVIFGAGTVFMAALHAMVVAGAMGRVINMSLIVPALVGLLFMVIGNFLGKVRSNFFVGFRTPWTLSSELSWNKTNRLAGWLFVLYGACIIVAAIAGNGNVLLSTFIAGSVVVCIVPAAYSYLIWKKDPGKRAGGT